MPNQRNSDRVPLNLWVDPKLLESIETGRKTLRGMDRSQFIRDAIKEKLIAMGYEVPDDIVLPPDRAAGAKRKKVVHPAEAEPASPPVARPEPRSVSYTGVRSPALNDQPAQEAENERFEREFHAAEAESELNADDHAHPAERDQTPVQEDERQPITPGITRKRVPKASI